MAEPPIEILLIEDNPADARLTREVLLGEGILNHLSVVSDGESAIRFLRRENPHAQAPRPDMILLDLNLPGKSGREVLAQIKSDDALRRIPVVILSSSSRDKDIISAYNLHAGHYIIKPSNIDDFPQVAKSIKNFWLSVKKESQSPRLVRVLVIEDSAADARWLQELLREGSGDGPVYEMTNADRLSRALETLGQSQFDAIISDLTLPDSIGLDTFAAIHKVAPQAPIIILTAIDDETIATKAVQAGAQDYLVKGSIDSKGLMRAIQYAIERKRLERIREEFAALTSHELRSPLAALSTALSVISEGPLSEEQKGILGIARRNAARLNRTIDNILEIAGMRAGKSKQPKESADIVALAQGVISDLSAKAKSKKLELKGDFPPGEVRLSLEQDSIVEVFTNLVVNALKFTPAGSVTVRIRDKGSEVECSVSDTGIGIAAEDLPKAFVQFKQFGVPPAGEARGSGLGLYIVKKLLEKHNGTISVSSKIGQGTKFSFVLPK